MHIAPVLVVVQGGVRRPEAHAHRVEVGRRWDPGKRVGVEGGSPPTSSGVVRVERRVAWVQARAVGASRKPPNAGAGRIAASARLGRACGGRVMAPRGTLSLEGIRLQPAVGRLSKVCRRPDLQALQVVDPETALGDGIPPSLQRSRTQWVTVHTRTQNRRGSCLRVSAPRRSILPQRIPTAADARRTSRRTGSTS